MAFQLSNKFLFIGVQILLFITGFPTGVENMGGGGGSSKFDGGGGKLKSIYGGSMGRA